MTTAAVVGVCGFSGSGKTTLIEGLLPRLTQRGLTVAVVKHDAHGFTIDTPGKDSDRLFRAGATVALGSAEETAWRWHPGPASTLARTLRRLLDCHDLVLVEGHKETPLAKLWLSAADGAPPPPAVTGIIAVLPRDRDRLARAEALVLDHLAAAWRERPRLGGLLVGGRSRRMGRAKALVEVHGQTLAERVHGALASVVDEIVLLGDGPVPAALADLPRLPDAGDTTGPAAGLLAALRWAPTSTWVVAACDLARLHRAAVAWLVAQRRPGAWAVLPATERGLEPLLAVYEPQALALLEDLVATGGRAPRRLAEHPQVLTPRPDDALLGAFTNVNTPPDLDALI